MDWTALLEANPVKKLKELTAKAAKPKEDKRPAQRRAKLLEAVNAARAQHAAGEEAPKRGIYKRIGDYARVELRVGRTRLPLKGEEFGLVPWERLPDFLNGVAAHVESGGFDEDIIRSLSPQANGSAPQSSSGAHDEPKKRRGPMSPDVVAKRNATRAANKARREAEKAAEGQGAPA